MQNNNILLQENLREYSINKLILMEIPQGFHQAEGK